MEEATPRLKDECRCGFLFKWYGSNNNRPKNDHGQAIDGGSWLFEYVLDTTIVEAMALLKELELAKNLGVLYGYI